VHCSPPQPFNLLMHKGLSTRGNPFFFRFGRIWAQNSSQLLRKPHIIFTNDMSIDIERKSHVAGNAYTLSPLGCNAIRNRLFEMVIGDPQRKESAFALLGQIELWRLEHGRPADEPRHPAIESEIPWPPLLS
jgi:hypothetical protein